MKKRLTPGAEQAVTTRDIAEKTGLSKMTVSRVLNNHPYVSDETRRKVMTAVRDLGFRPNTLAKRFFTGKTRLLGVIIPLEYMFSSFYFKELFQGVLECAEEAGYDILLHNSTSKKIPALDKCLDLVKGKLAEGLLLAAPMSYDTFPIRLTQEGVPLVITGESACGDKVNRVSIPNRVSARDAFKRLIALGHRRVAILSFEPDHMESQERLLGCKDALDAAGLPFDKDLVIPAHYNRREAFRAIQRIMPAHTDVTAIFALNADMALGAADALRSLGLKVPDVVSLVGFDDCEEMEEIEPPISTVRQYPYKVGHAACEMLLGLLAADSTPRKPQRKVIETEFMERGSMALAAVRRGSA
jgi:LacI family transcriptional regulator